MMSSLKPVLPGNDSVLPATSYHPANGCISCVSNLPGQMQSR